MDDDVCVFRVASEMALEFCEPGLEVELVVRIRSVSTSVGVLEIEGPKVLHIGCGAEDTWGCGFGKSGEKGECHDDVGEEVYLVDEFKPIFGDDYFVDDAGDAGVVAEDVEGPASLEPSFGKGSLKIVRISTCRQGTVSDSTAGGRMTNSTLATLAKSTSQYSIVEFSLPAALAASLHSSTTEAG